MSESYAGHERRHDASVQERVHHLEQSVDALWREVNTMKAEVNRNTQLTAAVKQDTEELVALFKGSKITAGILKWAVGIGASVVAIMAAMGRFKGL